MAVMAEPTQQRVHHGVIAQEVAPFVILQVGGDEGGVTVVAFLHQLEEDVGLFGFQI